MHRTLRIATLAVLTAGAFVPAHAQDDADRLSLHGYLTQAYARTNELPLLGMTKDGTTDYRAAALQLRYGMTDNDNFVVQIQHRRVGNDPMMTMTNDVELDWAFYERKLPYSTSLRVGKMPIPSGIFNEVRDVGVLLPFHQAPNWFYADGIETLDGLLLSHVVGAGRAFSLELTGYAGEWDYIETEYTVQGARAAKSRNKNSLGARVWLRTPIDGLEGGFSANRFEAVGGVLRPEGVKSKANMVTASVNGDFSRFDVRSEAMRVESEGAQIKSIYGQVGINIVEQLQLNAQLQVARVSVSLPMFSYDEEYGRDFALGIKYSPMTNLAVKLEGHRARGYMWAQPMNPLAPGLKGRYLIGGVAVSF